MKTMTTRKSKEEVQAELESMQKQKIEQKYTIIEIYKIVEIVLANKEISLFKVFLSNPAIQTR